MKLLVIDGNSIVNRAFFGMHPLNNREGFPTHAIFGFLNILRRMEEEEMCIRDRCKISLLRWTSFCWSKINF